MSARRTEVFVVWPGQNPGENIAAKWQNVTEQSCATAQIQVPQIEPTIETRVTVQGADR